MGRIEIDRAKCKRCGACVAVCIENHVYADCADGSGVPRVVKVEECIECGHCVAVCPGDAITHKGLDVERFADIDVDGLPDAAAVEALLSSLRTIRHYKDKPVPDAVIDKLLLIGSMAASEHNAQDREFIVVRDEAAIRGLSGKIAAHYKMLLKVMSAPMLGIMSLFVPGMAAYLKRSLPDMRRKVEEYTAEHDSIFHGAPCVIVITSSKGNILGKDTALTSQEAIRILAHSMGLGTCISGYAIGAPSVVKRALKIPGNRKLETVFTLGYPTHKFRKTAARRPPVVRGM